MAFSIYSKMRITENFKKITALKLLIMVFFVNYAQAQSQITLPEARFFKDSVKIGEEVKISLTFSHKPKMEVVFPDSSFDFAPFEFIKKQYFPTRSDTSASLDSVVYTLSTFELDPELKLSLPVFIFENGDTTQLFSDEATIILDEILPQITPKDSLKVNTEFKYLDTKLNYPYLLIGLGILGIIVIIVFIFFRKKLVNQYVLYTMKKDYEKFIKKYEDVENQYGRSPSSTILEDILSLWKKYLEKLEKIPYTSLTTKEITQLLDLNQLTSSLQNFDRAIYGGYINQDMSSSIGYLKDTAQQKYLAKQKEIRNA